MNLEIDFFFLFSSLVAVIFDPENDLKELVCLFFDFYCSLFSKIYRNEFKNFILFLFSFFLLSVRVVLLLTQKSEIVENMEESRIELFNKPKEILDLPEECVLEVLSYLSLKDLCYASRTCKIFYKLITQRLFRSMHVNLSDIYGDICIYKFARQFLKYAKRIRVINKNIGHIDSNELIDLLYNQINHIEMNELTLEAHLNDITPDNARQLSLMLVNVYNVTLRGCCDWWNNSHQINQREYIYPLFKYATQLESISLAKFDTRNVSLLGRTRFDHLRVLDFSLCKFQEAPIFGDFIRSIGTTLTEFYWRQSELENESYYSGTMQICEILSTHARRLQALTLDYRSVRHDHLTEPLEDDSRLEKKTSKKISHVFLYLFLPSFRFWIFIDIFRLFFLSSTEPFTILCWVYNTCNVLALVHSTIVTVSKYTHS